MPFVERKYLALILLLAFVLIFFRLTRADIIKDDAHYSFRSIQYLDYMASQKQTTPLQWFGEIPAWSKLSFHDAPPLVFLVQHSFFKIFGVNAFAAKLPFALAGLLSVALVFLITRQLYSARTALLASLFLAVNNYFIWISRVGYLESIALLFILGAIYFLLKSRASVNYIFLFGLSLGLAFLSKYTSFYLIPFFLAYVFWQRRDLIGEHKYKFIPALLITLVLFLPVIIYNVLMFKTKGHFDMQFAALFNQSVTDWPIIERAAGAGFFGNFASIIHTLINAFSLPVFLLFCLALFFLLYEEIRFRTGKHLVVLLNLLFLTTIFMLTGAADRYLPLYAPFFAIAAAYPLGLRTFLGSQKIFVSSAIFVFIAHQLFFTVNTNHLYKPLGRPNIAYSTVRIENFGFKQLDNYFEALLKGTKADPWAMYPDFHNIPELVERGKKLNTDENLKPFSSLILYDRNIDWFGRMWVFERRRLLKNYLLFSFDELFEQSQLNKNLFTDVGVNSAYIVLAAGKNKDDGSAIESFSDKAGNVESYLKSVGASPEKIIYNPAGEEAFRVYLVDDYQKILEIL